MTLKFPAATTFAANKLALLLAATAVMAIGATSVAQAESLKYDKRGRVTYGSGGPNVSYQSGPRTRVYISKRSWLDAGTEVLPGERKFQDYAFPPGTSFGQQNLNRPLDRQPFNPGSDFGYGDGYNGQGRFPLY